MGELGPCPRRALISLEGSKSTVNKKDENGKRKHCFAQKGGKPSQVTAHWVLCTGTGGWGGGATGGLLFIRGVGLKWVEKDKKIGGPRAYKRETDEHKR